MKYVSQLNENEVRYICSVIPLQATVRFFTRNPKVFAKVRPGFRATSLKSLDQASSILFKGRNDVAILSFIEEHVGQWLKEISEHLASKMEHGDSKETAFLRVLPFSFFVNNVPLYFKLAGEEQPDEYVVILASSVRAIRDLDDRAQRLTSTLTDKEAEVKHKHIQLDRAESDLKRAKIKIREYTSEIRALKRTSAQLQETLETYVSQAQERDRCIQEMKAEMAVAQWDKRLLESQVQEALQEQECLTAVVQFSKTIIEDMKFREEELQASVRELKAGAEKQERSPCGNEPRNPKCPKDIDEFKECLGYNLVSIGIPDHAEYLPILKEHLSVILFQGVPIVINRAPGIVLAKCISNALVGTPYADALIFESQISEQTIDQFLSTATRVVCLDNFIGNFNETVLLTLCERHKDKVIFLTTAYDRTLCYVPDGFLTYCHYLNVNRIPPFFWGSEIAEDPSVVDETEAIIERVPPESRYSSLLKDVLGECGVGRALSERKSALAYDEHSLCRTLAFEVLPYCVDVLDVTPFRRSERLVKYAGDTGRCSYRGLFGEWFA